MLVDFLSMAYEGKLQCISKSVTSCSCLPYVMMTMAEEDLCIYIRLVYPSLHQKSIFRDKLLEKNGREENIHSSILCNILLNTLYSTQHVYLNTDHNIFYKG